MQAVTGQPIKKKKQLFSNSAESLLATNRCPKSLRPLVGDCPRSRNPANSNCFWFPSGRRVTRVHSLDLCKFRLSTVINFNHLAKFQINGAPITYKNMHPQSATWSLKSQRYSRKNIRLQCGSCNMANSEHQA